MYSQKDTLLFSRAGNRLLNIRIITDEYLIMNMWINFI